MDVRMDAAGRMDLPEQMDVPARCCSPLRRRSRNQPPGADANSASHSEAGPCRRENHTQNRKNHRTPPCLHRQITVRKHGPTAAANAANARPATGATRRRQLRKRQFDRKSRQFQPQPHPPRSQPRRQHQTHRIRPGEPCLRHLRPRIARRNPFRTASRNRLEHVVSTRPGRYQLGTNPDPPQWRSQPSALPGCR